MWLKLGEYLSNGCDLSSNARLVLLALVAHVNRQGRCYPSVGRIATVAGISRRSVFNALDELDGVGLVTRTRRRTSTLYEVNL